MCLCMENEKVFKNGVQDSNYLFQKLLVHKHNIYIRDVKNNILSNSVHIEKSSIKKLASLLFSMKLYFL